MDRVNPRYVVCDIDGTLALHTEQERGHFEYDKVGADRPNWSIIRLLCEFRSAGYGVIFVSGREESCRGITLRWLAKHVERWAGNCPLYMRPTGDHCKDYVLKRRIYEEHLKPLHHQIAWVLEDRDQVVRLWRELGLTCLQVADGDF